MPFWALFRSLAPPAAPRLGLLLRYTVPCCCTLHPQNAPKLPQMCDRGGLPVHPPGIFAPRPAPPRLRGHGPGDTSDLRTARTSPAGSERSPTPSSCSRSSWGGFRPSRSATSNRTRGCSTPKSTSNRSVGNVTGWGPVIRYPIRPIRVATVHCRQCRPSAVRFLIYIIRLFRGGGTFTERISAFLFFFFLFSLAFRIFTAICLLINHIESS